MKKNKMMRLAAILLVCVLMTTSVISGTFAKYTSSATVTDKARVAYWGFGKAAAIEFDLFDGEYDGTVDSEDGDNVVAPGTDKTATFGFAYTDNTNDAIKAPEVDYAFEVDATITGDYDSLDANVNFYWTLDGKNYNTAADLLAAIEKLDGDKDYEAGQLPTGFGVNDTHTIGWAWKFGTGVEDEDEADTAMGNADPLENIEITIKITATQVD